MFSKTHYKLPLIIFFILSLTHCGLKIGEENKTKDTAEVQSIACLDSTISDIKLFFAGSASDDQVASSLQCLQDVFISFKENIRGENKDAFTAREIAIFVEKNFIKDGTTFSDTFLAELMNFKVAVIGGTNQLFLKSEIDNIVSLLAVIKPDLVRLNRSMRIISFKWAVEFQPQSSEEKEQQFLQAKSDFNKLIQKISGEFAKVGNVYQLDDLINFAKEILKLGKSDISTIDAIEKARPFVKKFKVLLIGGDISLTGSEWSRLGTTLHEGLFQLLRYQYFLKDLKDTETAVKWNGYEKIAIDLSGLVENLLDAKETQMLSNFELYEISQSLDSIYPEIMLSLPLIESIGHIKVMLLGDSPSGRIGWSKTDFAKLRIKIPQLFSEFAVLAKTYEYVQSSKDSQNVWHTTVNEFESVEARTITSVQALSEMMERPYNIYYLKVLIEELSKGLFKDSLVLPKNFESLFKVALSAKTVMTGEEDNNIGVSNLKLLLKIGIRAYLNFIEYDIFIAPSKADQADFFVHLERIFQKSINTIDLNLKLKSPKFFTTQQLTNLVLTLQTENILKTQLTQPSLEKMFLGLWNNLLTNPEDRINGKTLPGFDFTVLQQASHEGSIFLKTQKVLSEIFVAAPLLTKTKLKSEIWSRLSDITDQQTKTGLTEINNLITANMPLNLNSQGFLKLLTADVGIFNFEDLLKSNISRAGARLFIRAYAEDLKRAVNLIGVTQSEAEIAYKQFKGIAVDIKLVEMENTSFMTSRFMEANMFLGTSNGDNLVNFGELHQLIIHIMSGMARADVLKEKILKSCLPPQYGEITTKTAIWEDCLLKLYYTETEAYAELPQFLNLKKQFSEKENKEFYLSLLKAIGHVPNDKKVVYFVDADLFPHVIQYVEMVYARHDLNHDKVLEKCEALKAFPIYRDLIRQLTTDYKLSEKQLPGVFIYLLKFGRPPVSALEKLKFISFINNPNKWDIQATRIDLGKIFNFIGESIKGKTPPAEPELLLAPVKPLEPIVTGCEEPEGLVGAYRH